MDLDNLIEPMRKGMTVTVGYDDMTGEATEPVVGHGHDPNSPFADDIPQDFINPEALSNEVEEPDEQIAGAVLELYGGDMDNILDFMEATYPQEMVAAYDKAIDDADWSTALPMLEQVAQDYYEQGGQVPQQQYSDDDISEELDGAEPQGYEAAMNILQHAEQAQGAERDLLMVSAEFHAGRISADDAYQQLLQKYSKEEIIPLYEKWSQ